ncbi:5-formyltetrahydrofolate cyclo-ligase [Flavobacterium filum]|uniref:5-formyltetrahydrofolate cyclo-ligase n=1 Tax=Flavobacterium filum TaxID=370974 RepID=UPI0023F217B3|nr:5-formyltetrahydrofolate cyclo-ligase [Flavobacterium filum]
MEINEEKKTIRKLMLEKRRKLDTLVKLEYDQFICDQLELIILKNGYKVIHAYIPIANEIDITPLLIKLLKYNITLICPKTLPKRRLENRVLKSLNELEVGIKGTLYPVECELFNGKYDLIIVPGLAFDDRNYRLGYGGGYYDNFLVKQPESYKVGIFYPFQKVDLVPIELHDICLDTILVKEI